MRDASGTPATPMMPHMLRSVSHASRNGAVIYVAQPGDRLVDRSVSQHKTEGPIHGTHRAGAEQRDTELAGQCLYRRRAPRSARVSSPIIPTTGVGSTAPVGLSL